MKKLIALATLSILLLFLLTGCDVDCKTQQISIFKGEIPDTILNCVPYKNGDVVKFINSEGTLLSYHVVREEKQITDQILEECYVYTTVYQEDESNLLSDSATYPINLWITNKVDYDFYDVRIINEAFTIPATDFFYQQAEVIDSMTINNVLYYNIIIETPNYIESQNPDSLVAETLFYNYEFGILRIDFTDGDELQRVP